MIRYKNNLPQLSEKLFITDGGLETTMIFLEGRELPYFAACDLLNQDGGVEALREYFRRYLELARLHEVGFILESVTWRASADWGEKLGYSQEQLEDMNNRAITMLHELRDEYVTERTPIVVSGCIGPRGDGYDPGQLMTELEAELYHRQQIKWLRDAGVDMVSAFTMTNIPEAVGIVRAARGAEIPVVISFTLETDGRLPTGQTLQEAILKVDAATNNGPTYYMINCAHPTHFESTVAGGQAWLKRIRGVRANASCRSHEELDNSTDLDAGNPVELGAQYRELRQLLPHLNILGGCCGTDHRHVTEICEACLA